MAKWEGPDEGLQAVGRHPQRGANDYGSAQHPSGKRPDPVGNGHERAGGLGKDAPADAVADKALGGLKNAGAELATSPADGLRPQVNNDPNGSQGDGTNAAGSGAGKPQALGTTKATPGDGLAELGKANLPKLHANQPDKQAPASGDQANKDGASKGLDPAGLAQQAKQLATHPQALLGKAKGGYQQLEDKATVWVGKASQKAGFHWSEKLTKRVTRSMIVAMTGGALWGGVAMGNYQQRPLDDGTVCSTLNTGDDSYSDINPSVGGTSADWTKPGTENYKIAKKVIKTLKSIGLSGVAIAGVLGNAAHESGGLNPGILNSLGDGGKGLIQWTGGRRTQLEELAASMHKSSSDLDVQLAMLKKDFSNPGMWVSGYKKLTPSIFNSLKDPGEAALRFYLSQFEAGGGYDHDPDGTASTREAYAKLAYATFHLSGVKGNTAKLESLVGGSVLGLANDNASTAEKANTANCKGTGNDNVSDGNIVNTARKIKDKLHWTYDQGQRNDWSNDKKFDEVTKFSELKDDGHSDCSSFVDVVYQLCGYKTPHGAGNAWTTISMMDTYSKGDNKMLEEVPAEKAKAGDAAVGNQHAVILTEDWHGDDTKDIESAVPGQGIDESTLGWHPDKGALHFYHPIKK